MRHVYIRNAAGSNRWSTVLQTVRPDVLTQVLAHVSTGPLSLISQIEDQIQEEAQQL